MGLLDGIFGSKEGGGMSPLTKILLGLLAAKAASSFFGRGDAPADAKAGAEPAPDNSGTIQSGILAGMPSLGSLFGRGEGSDAGGAAESRPAAGGGTIESGILAGLPSLGSLLDHFRSGGLGDHVDSWVGSGENKPVAPTELSQVLDERTVGELEKATGLSREQLLQQLANVLPQAIDKLTPDGRAPR